MTTTTLDTGTVDNASSLRSRFGRARTGALALVLAAGIGTSVLTPATAAASITVPGTATLSGTALDRAGESLGTGAVEVTAYRQTTADGVTSWRPAAPRVKTRVDGRWQIAALPPGTYRVGFHVVSPDLAGFVDQYFEDVPTVDAARSITLEPNEEEENVDAYLRSIYPNGRYTVSAHATLSVGTAYAHQRVAVSGRVSANVLVDRGTMTVRDAGRVLMSHRLTSADRGRYRFVLPLLRPGTHSITIGYESPSRFNPDMSNSHRLVVRQVPSTVRAAVRGTPTSTLRPKLGIVVRSTGITPTGTVTLSEAGRRLTRVTLTAGHRGAITVTLPKLTVGRHALTVVYTGSTTVKASRTAVAVTVRR